MADPLVQQALAAKLRGQPAPAPDDQDPQGLYRQRALGMLMQMSGNQQLGGIGGALTGEADKLQQVAREAPGLRLKNLLSQQKLEQEGPQPALGGQTPSNYEMLTKRQMVQRNVPAGQFPGSLDTRSGKYTPYADANGQPVTDVHTQREREKRKASLNVGPDLEPSEDLMGKVESGLADPKSPGMEGPLKELAKLNAAAGGFSDVAQQLRDFYAKHPNGALTGTDATKAEAVAQDLRSLYMQNLNMQTLRSSDIPILDKVISDPSSLSSMIKSSTGLRDLSAQLDTAVNLAKQRTLSQAASLGYRPSAKGRYAGFQQTTDKGAGGGGTAALRSKYGL